MDFLPGALLCALAGQLVSSWYLPLGHRCRSRPCCRGEYIEHREAGPPAQGHTGHEWQHWHLPGQLCWQLPGAVWLQHPLWSLTCAVSLPLDRYRTTQLGDKSVLLVALSPVRNVFSTCWSVFPPMFVLMKGCFVVLFKNISIASFLFAIPFEVPSTSVRKLSELVRSTLS